MHVLRYLKQTMSKTPQKSGDFWLCYTPKELSIPNKDNSGVSKTIFTHVSDLHRLLTDWMRTVDNATKICRAISELKLHEFEDHFYPNTTRILSENLSVALSSLKNIVDGVEILNNKLQALAQLQPDPTPVIHTWTAKQISEYVTKLLVNVQKEYKIKEVISENIAHCRDENLMELYVSSWKFDMYFKIESTEFLFAEVGLPIIQ